MLDYERQNSKALQSILLRGPESVEDTPKEDFRPTRPRKLTWSQRAEGIRQQRRQQTEPELTKAEEIFESQLK